MVEVKIEIVEKKADKSIDTEKSFKKYIDAEKKIEKM